MTARLRWELFSAETSGHGRLLKLPREVRPGRDWLARGQGDRPVALALNYSRADLPQPWHYWYFMHGEWQQSSSHQTLEDLLLKAEGQCHYVWGAT